jgi:hypothetical protein
MAITNAPSTGWPAGPRTVTSSVEGEGCRTDRAAGGFGFPEADGAGGLAAAPAGAGAAWSSRAGRSAGSETGVPRAGCWLSTEDGCVAWLVGGAGWLAATAAAAANAMSATPRR